MTDDTEDDEPRSFSADPSKPKPTAADIAAARGAQPWHEQHGREWPFSLHMKVLCGQGRCRRVIGNFDYDFTRDDPITLSESLRELLGDESGGNGHGPATKPQTHWLTLVNGETIKAPFTDRDREVVCPKGHTRQMDMRAMIEAILNREDEITV